MYLCDHRTIKERHLNIFRDDVKDATLRAVDAPTEPGVDKVVQLRSQNVN